MWLIILLALACHRVTRFVIADSLIADFRIWLHLRILGDGTSKVRAKFHELISCFWCLSVWVAGALVLVVDQFAVVPLPWLTVPAVSSAALVVYNLVD